MAAVTGVLRAPRLAALVAIAALVAAASLVSFAESYRGLFLWAHKHGLGRAAPGRPSGRCRLTCFIAVGELALFVALADRWAPRSRAAAWAVTLAGLAVSVAGNVGHVSGHALAGRVTAAVPPLAAASALAVGLGVLKRVVESHHECAGAGSDDPSAGPAPAPIAQDAEQAAQIALRATLAAGNPLSGRQLETRFGLTRTEATNVRQLVIAEANGNGTGGEVSGDEQGQ